MSETNTTGRYDQSVLDSIFITDKLVNPQEVLHGWALIIDDKFWTKNGRFLWNTREEVVRAFYNSISYRATYALCQTEEHSTAEPYYSYYPSRDDRSRLWKQFKETLTKHHGLKIVKI